MSDTADEANHDVLDEAAHYLAKARVPMAASVI